jgi:hypothetical protein
MQWENMQLVLYSLIQRIPQNDIAPTTIAQVVCCRCTDLDGNF